MKRLLFLLILCMNPLFGISQAMRGVKNPNVNRTHFVIRNGKQYVPSQRTAPYSISTQENGTKGIRTFFTSKHDLHAEIIAQIEKEDVRIRIAMYAFTDQGLMDCFIKAHKRGVTVELITDYANTINGYSNIDKLVKEGIAVWHNKPKTPIMHHKFVIYDGTKEVWTGSSNFTKSGQKHNYENLNALSGEEVVQDYDEQYNHMKAQCVRYNPIKN